MGRHLNHSCCCALRRANVLQTDGQLLQTLGCVVNPSNALAMAAQTNVQFSFMDDWMFTMVSWLKGQDTCIQVVRQSQQLQFRWGR